jgi:hypothetical protein
LLALSAIEVFSQVPPTLISPANGDNCVKKFALLEWSQVPNAVSYRVEVADNPDFDTPIAYITDLTVTSTSVAVPNWNSTYYWRATSVFANNNTGVSAARNFKTKLPPLNLVFPTNESVCNDTLIQFKWNKADAEFYHLQVSENLAFDTLVLTKDNITDTTFSVKLPKYSKTYFWRVASIKSLCKTEFSVIWSLTTKQAPPVLLSPLKGSFGGSIFTAPPFSTKLIWKKVNPMDLYDVQVSKSPIFANYVINATNFADTSITLNLPTEYDSLYYWRVRIIKDGCASYWSNVFTFRLPYQKPDLATPLNNETCVTMSKTFFRWSTIPVATKYRLQVSDTISFTRLIIDSANINDRQINVDLKNPVKVHYWRVRGEDSQNNGLWSDTRSFTTTQKAPAITFPLNNAIGLRKTIDFTWDSFGVGALYDMKLFADQALTIKLLDTTGLDTNHFKFTVPNDNKIYYWQIRAKFGVCQGDWSAIYSFKTLIQSPQLISPANKATKVSLNPIYTWSSVAEANSYEIEISLDSLIAKRLVNDKNIKSTTWTYPALEYKENTKYYWHVRAVNNDGVSVWSQIFSFTTDALPADAPRLISPSNNAIKISNNPKLFWSKVAKANSYIVSISTDKNFDNIYLYQEVTDTTLVVAGLERFTSYWWSVTTKDVNGKGSTSPVFIFRTEDIKPDATAIPLTPLDKSKNQPLILNFKWNTVERAMAYHLQVANNNTFAEGSLFTEFTSVKDTQRTVIDFEYNKTYFWRVAGWNEAGQGEWSAVREFSTPLNSSIKDNDFNVNSHSISPNPVKNILQVNVNALQSSNSKLKICDLNGNIVYQSGDIEIYSGNNTYSFAIGNLNSGFYFYYLESNSGTVGGKIIVE